MRMLTDKKGLSDVVATIILCGVVLIVGISVWSSTYMVTSGLQSDYYEKIQNQVEKISERFIIEHVSYNGITVFKVWVYNYGDITEYGDLSIDIIVYVYEEGVLRGGTSDFINIPSGETAEITINLNQVLTAGSEVVVKAVSKRDSENVAYRTYVVPSAQS